MKSGRKEGMEFFTLKDVPRTPGEVTYRYRWGGLLFAVVFLAVPGFAMWAAVIAGLASGRMGTGSAVGLGLWGLMCISIARWLAGMLWVYLRPESNWLMRQGPAGMLLHFRSHFNTHLSPGDPTVVRIPWHAIEWARRTREVRLVRSSDGDGPANQWKTCLDLKVRSDDLEALGEALATERGREGPWVKHWWGRSRGVARHAPIQVVEGGIVRIAWEASPRLGRVMKQLRHRVAIAPPFKMTFDFFHLERLSPEQQAARVLTLAREGDTIAAVALAEMAWGLTLTEAKKKVDAMLASDTPASPPAPVAPAA
jgi:hypothetical protein